MNKIWLFRDENKYMEFSSKIMSIIPIIGMFNGDYYLSPYFFSTASISSLYWSNPQYNCIRTMDIFLARIGVIGSILYNYYYIENIPIKIILPLTYSGAIGNYLYGCNLHAKRNRMWFVNHYLSHWISIFSHSIMIAYALNNKSNKLIL